MRCPKCSTENRDDARFCRKCGLKLNLICPQCGRELLPDTQFCDACGAQVGVSAPTTVTLPDQIQRLAPKGYVEQLLAIRGQARSERRVMTILFSDVKGSSAMAENLDPEDLAEIMDGAFGVLIEPH